MKLASCPFLLLLPHCSHVRAAFCLTGHRLPRHPSLPLCVQLITFSNEHLQCICTVFGVAL
jgi:hypothetical protein